MATQRILVHPRSPPVACCTNKISNMADCHLLLMPRHSFQMDDLLRSRMWQACGCSCRHVVIKIRNAWLRQAAAGFRNAWLRQIPARMAPARMAPARMAPARMAPARMAPAWLRNAWLRQAAGFHVHSIQQPPAWLGSNTLGMAIRHRWQTSLAKPKDAYAGAC